MKKIISILLSVMLVLTTLAACSKNTNEKESTSTLKEMELVTEIPAERVTDKTVESATSFANGDGTKESPFEISNAAELQYFANLFYDIQLADNESIFDYQNKYQSAYYILTNDIVINSDDEMKTADTKAPTYKWDAIGRNSGDYDNITYLDFEGNFDGRNHYISGLYNCVLGEGTNSPDATIGLFANLKGATVSNLTIKNSYFYVYNTVGGIGTLASSAYNSFIDNCHCENVNIYAHSSIGGTAGFIGNIISTANITNCSVSGNIKGGYASDVAGITAFAADGIIENCTNNAEIIGFENANAGGICGYISDSQTTDDTESNEKNGVVTDNTTKNHGKTQIVNCINNGAVTSEMASGGIAARADSGKAKVVISNCKNTGIITGKQEVGGISGTLLSEKGTTANINKTVGSFAIENCENTGNINGETMLGGIVGHSTADSSATANITNCKNSGTIKGKTIGGIVATAQTSDAAELIISSCENNGKMICTGEVVGGIAGLFTTLDDGCDGYVFEISNCKNSGLISSNGREGQGILNVSIGGILGKKESTGCKNDKFTISSCENTGDFNCETDCYVGGIAGYLLSTTDEEKSVDNCTNSGNINVKIIDYDYENETEKETKVYNYAGGIAGTAQDNVTFDNCKSTGKLNVVSGDENKIHFEDICSLTVKNNVE